MELLTNIVGVLVTSAAWVAMIAAAFSLLAAWIAFVAWVQD